MVLGIKKRNLLALGIPVFAVFCTQAPERLEAQNKEKTYWIDQDPKVSAEVPAIDVVALNNVFTGLAERLSLSVVSISTKTKLREDPRLRSQEDMLRYFFGNPFGNPGARPQQRESQSMGSGFLINDEGYIITNSHVIRQSGRTADEILAKFVSDPPNFPGHVAEVIGVDETTDVAVIKLKSKPKATQIAPLGDSSQIKVGEWVMAIGNPLGHSHSVTSGIVSALGRSLDGLESRAEFIQTDASINPGNSGGPLFNLKGQVIGINTAIDARAQNIGFAIPIDIAKSIVRQLIEKGRVDLGWIGVYMSELSPGIAQQLGIKATQGVLVQDVVPDEPAEKAGLKSYDVILKINGQDVPRIRDLTRMVNNMSVGAQAKFTVLRDGKQRDFILTIGRRKTDEELAAREQSRMKKSVETGRGMMFTNLNATLRQQLGLAEDAGGVLVQRVIDGSFSAEAGVLPGDILLEVNRKPVNTAQEAQSALQAKTKAYLLKIQRQDATLIVLMEMKK